MWYSKLQVFQEDFTNVLSQAYFERVFVGIYFVKLVGKCQCEGPSNIPRCVNQLEFCHFRL